MLAKKVKEVGVDIFSIIAHPDSRIENLSDFVLTIPAQTKLEMINSPKSIQSIANQFEQSLLQLKCSCSNKLCPRKYNCEECVTHHRIRNEISGCFFPPKAEKTRSFERIFYKMF